MVTAETKERIDKTARASGRTQSQEAEVLIERGLIADEIAKISGAKTDDIRQRLVEAALRADGFAPVHGADAGGRKIIVRWERRKSSGFMSEADAAAFISKDARDKK
jgi:hypothetical protein